MVLVGLWAQRRSRDSVDYFVGGRGLGPAVAALSASASSSSVWTLVGVSGFAYAHGVSAVWVFCGCMGGFALNWWGVAPRVRRLAAQSGAVTLTDILAGPRGKPGRRALVIAATSIVLMSLMTYVAAQFSGAGKAFASTFDISELGALCIGAGVVVLYTMLGGFWAVSVTDTVQGLLMTLAALALPIAGLAAVGGLDGLWEGLVRAGPRHVDFFDGLAPAAGLGFIVGLFGIGLGYPGQPHVVNRLMALRSEAALRRGRQIAMLWGTVVYAGMILAGLCARVLLEQDGGLGDHENAFFALTHSLFSPVVAGVMVAAVLSAIMSTADSQLLVAAASVSHDLRRSEQGPTRLLGPRMTVLLLSAVAVAVAATVDASIFSSVLFAWSAMGAAFGPLLLVILWRGRPSPPWALAAMLAGFSLAVLAHLWPGMGGGVLERVVPFFVAGALAWRGVARVDATRAA